MLVLDEQLVDLTRLVRSKKLGSITFEDEK